LQLHIWVRQTVDWEDEAAFEAQLDPEFRPRVERWNEVFSMPFNRFRARVKSIAARNLEATGIPRTAWDDIPAEALVLPVDDDDWFAPNIGDRLAACLDASSPGAYWLSAWLERPTSLSHNKAKMRMKFNPSLPRARLTTNNYALFKGLAPREAFVDHLEGSDWVDETLDCRGVRCIDEPLSLANRSIASQTSLRMGLSVPTRAMLVWKHRRYRTLYRKRPKPGLEWAAPYIDEMDALMRELKLR
jgi:hypothetical protein